jgi:hypothetical protein
MTDGMIDQLQRELKEHQQQLRDELERIDAAIAALAPGGTLSPRKRTRRAATAPSGSEAAAEPTSEEATRTPAPRRRSARGVTRSAVLAALSASEARTAGHVAAATGINRGPVSTMLNSLTKSGEAKKAQRGYLLAAS